MEFKIPFFEHDLGESEIQSIREVVSQPILTTGEFVRRFEEQFSDFLGCSEVIGLTSCTAALHLALVALDVGGRPYAVIKASFKDPTIGDMPSDLVRHFLEVFALEARINLHVRVIEGANDHHKAEAIFKGLARALRQAIAIDPRASGEIPSTKGTISS